MSRKARTRTTVLRGVRTGTIILLCVIGVAAVFVSGGWKKAYADDPSPGASGMQGGFADAIIQVAQAARPSVVHVDITGSIVQQAPASSPFGPPQGGPSRVPFRALGSGVLIGAEGYIITNNHVVENAKTIQVVFYDGSVQNATVVGQDPYTDLAVIKVPSANGIKPAVLGDSESLKVGEWVVAIGNPRGLDWTVTQGVISAKHRAGLSPLGPSGYQDYIQTDAAINPGNSGGPLLNLRNEVIGLNAAIISKTGGSEGLGFAIPVNIVKNVSQNLIKYGKITRSDIGIHFQDVTPPMVTGLKLPAGTEGVIVVEVIPNSPAGKTGLKQGDVITMYNGKKVTSSYQLRDLISNTSPGTQVTLTIIRNDKTMQVDVAAVDQTTIVKQEQSHPALERLGVQVAKVSPSLARRLQMPQPMGVVVEEVVPGSPADFVGLIPGDIILRVGRTQVSSPSDFSSLIGKEFNSGTRTVVLLVYDKRSGRVGYVTVPVG
jgi:serine protease Do